MIIKDKIKLKPKTKSKILVLGLILIVLVGLFGPVGKVQAVGPSGVCTIQTKDPSSNKLITEQRPDVDEQTCLRPLGIGGGLGGISWFLGAPGTTVLQNCIDAGGTLESCTALLTPPAAPTKPDASAFETAVKGNLCYEGWGSVSIQGCILQFVFWTFYTLGAWLLAIAASFFNFFIKITLGSELLKSDFISHAWGVVRDLSNIFFILILLYIALQIILDIGGHDAKKMIVKVMIMALLINFSMFFTQVIIDSSNILALIFYNKVNTVDKKNPDPNAAASLIDYVTGEKDIAGGLTQSFNPVYKLDSKFFTEAGIIRIPGQPAVKEPISTGTLIGITVIAGAVMLFAAYALFVSALSFLGRLIELFVLIIFSPFAFMSWSSSDFGKVEYIGWDAWWRRLLAVAFMAPIFMFFLYFIFLLLGEDMFKNILQGDGTVRTLLRIIIPALVILILLLKATHFAKKGSGALGEKLFAGAKMIGGLALGAATGGAGLALRGATAGAAVAGRASIGRVGAWAANTEWAKQREREGKFGSRAFTKVAGGIGSGNFDVRGVKIGGKTLASATGMNVGEAKKGGFTERKKEAIENRAKRAKELQVGENDPLKQALNKTEMDLQGLLGENAHTIETLDKYIEKKREEVTVANSKLNAAKGTAGEGAARAALTSANGNLDFAKQNKKDFRSGGNYMALNPHTGEATDEVDGTGVSIEALEEQKKDQAQKIKNKNVLSNQQYATASQKGGVRALNFVLTGGAYTKAAAEEAAHKIVMETKLDSGTNPH